MEDKDNNKLFEVIKQYPALQKIAIIVGGGILVVRFVKEAIELISKIAAYIIQYSSKLWALINNSSISNVVIVMIGMIMMIFIIGIVVVIMGMFVLIYKHMTNKTEIHKQKEVLDTLKESLKKFEGIKKIIVTNEKDKTTIDVEIGSIEKRNTKETKDNKIVRFTTRNKQDDLEA